MDNSGVSSQATPPPVEIREQRPYINGWQVPQCYVGQLSTGHHACVEFLGKSQYLVTCSDPALPRGYYTALDVAEVRLAEDERWVLGDTRDLGPQTVEASRVSGRVNTIISSYPRPWRLVSPSKHPELDRFESAAHGRLKACLSSPPAERLHRRAPSRLGSHSRRGTAERISVETGKLARERVHIRGNSWRSAMRFVRNRI